MVHTLGGGVHQRAEEQRPGHLRLGDPRPAAGRRRVRQVQRAVGQLHFAHPAQQDRNDGPSQRQQQQRHAAALRQAAPSSRRAQQRESGRGRGGGGGGGGRSVQSALFDVFAVRRRQRRRTRQRRRRSGLHPLQSHREYH